VLAIDLVTAVFAMSLLFAIRVPQPDRSEESGNGRFWRSFWADMGAGLRYVWDWPALMLLMGMAMMINLVLNPAFSLLPLLITDHFGGDALQLGFVQSAFGLGLLVGGLLLGVWGGFKRRILTSLVGLIGMGSATVVMGLTPSDMLWLAVFAFFLVGATNSLVNGPIFALFQTTIAPEMQGRVFTLIGSLAGAMSPIGLIIAGPVADWLGVQTWYLIGGGVTILMGIGGFFIPLLMNIEDNSQAQLSPLSTPTLTPSVSETAAQI
jgi:MFS transporter, DHA3 family, macrolide efflux protein